MPNSNPQNAGSDGGQNQNNAVEQLRSKNSNKHAYIRFVNMTRRRVDVIWINYEGVRVKYKTLEPGEYFDITSFVSHPWIFRDAETHTKLVVSSQEVFDVPEPVYLRLQNGRVQATRAIVAITLPLYSLMECSLQAVQKLIRDPAQIQSLDIPFTLKKELLERCAMKSRISMLHYAPQRVSNANNNQNQQ